MRHAGLRQVMVAGWIGLAVSACSFDGVPEVPGTCASDADCAPGARCLEQLCTSGPPDMRPPAAQDMRSRADEGPGPAEEMGAPLRDQRPDARPPAPEEMGPGAEEMSAGPCGPDVDGDGAPGGPGCPIEVRDCDDDNELIYPGAPRRCNEQDNDCDGLIDRETCECQPDQSEPCGIDEGACQPGTRRCQGGRWTECQGRVGPRAESCDGIDNDCDGRADETFPAQGDACMTGLPGACGPGRWGCAGGEQICVQGAASQLEVCDGIDNDCDGDVDEDADGLVLVEACSPGVCPGQGVRVCLEGSWSGCTIRDIEICNGADTNCDALRDNRSRCLVACGGRVATGTLSCQPQGAACQLPDEICADNVDNDCDGRVDEGCQPDSALRNMAYVPGGTFIMGSRSVDTQRQSDETPPHLVDLSPFYIDLTEVTRAQYTACVSAGVCDPPQVGGPCPQGQSLGPGSARKPIACLLYADAEAYCQWAGKRLPTEAEWEKAARGPFDRAVLYPWGDLADAGRAAVGCTTSLEACLEPVDARPNGRSYYGLHHMAGNVAEYTQDHYATNFYQLSELTDPVQTQPAGGGRVVRGGSWRLALRNARTANRIAEAATGLSLADLGVRCALDAP